MDQIEFHIGRSSLTPMVSSVLLDEDDDPREALVKEVVQSIATDIEVRVGEVTMHLAAWMDPEHWSWDWEQTTGEEDFDVDALLASARTVWRHAGVTEAAAERAQAAKEE